MLEKLSVEDFFKIRDEVVAVDFRTKEEFSGASIPNSTNIPILYANEHREVSILYNEGKIREAKSLAITFVSKRLPVLYDELSLMARDKPLVGLCSRGGYRSGVIVSLLRAIGENVSKLDGGYKAYRKYVNSHLEEYFSSLKLTVLYGKTGVGKTQILKELKKLGANVIDLEEIACHRGSLLGSIGIFEQTTQKNFEANLFDLIEKHRGEHFFIEGESKRIGKIILPSKIYDHLVKSEKILIDAPIELRIENIKREYVGEKDEVIFALNLLKPHISEKRLEEYKTLIIENRSEEVIRELMLFYYDAAYKKHSDFIREEINLNSKITAEKLIAR